MKQKSNTYYSQTFKRLRRNKGAIAGLIVICIAVVIALFAYILASDHSPNANRIIPEIANKKPGFSIYLVHVKKEALPSSSVINQFFNGQPSLYTYIPATNYTIKGDSLFFNRFIDDGLMEKTSLPLSILAAKPVKKYHFYFGTDRFGRDILSRLIIGARVSLNVGLIAVIISLTIGILLGAVAGYYRGKTDDIIMWFINVIWSIPTLLLVFAITLVLGKGFWQVFIAVGLTMWVNVARLVRGQVISLKEKEFVEAARAMGFSNSRIIIKHILPNILGPILVIAASNFASAIVIEAGLSFLGVGVQPPQPSWGLMIKENYNFIITNNPMLAIIPGIAIIILVLAFNLLGNGLRDALNVRSKL